MSRRRSASPPPAGEEAVPEVEPGGLLLVREEVVAEVRLDGRHRFPAPPASSGGRAGRRTCRSPPCRARRARRRASGRGRSARAGARACRAGWSCASRTRPIRAWSCENGWGACSNTMFSGERNIQCEKSPALELAERHREADRARARRGRSAPPAPSARRRANAGWWRLLWLTPSRDAPRRRQLRQLAGLAARKGEGFLHEDADPRLQELRGPPATWRSGGVSTWATSTSRPASSSSGGHGGGDAPLLRQRRRPLEVRVADRDDLHAGDLGQRLQVEARHVPRADQGDTEARPDRGPRRGLLAGGEGHGPGIRDRHSHRRG